MTKWQWAWQAVLYIHRVHDKMRWYWDQCMRGIALGFRMGDRGLHKQKYDYHINRATWRWATDDQASKLMTEQSSQQVDERANWWQSELMKKQKTTWDKSDSLINSDGGAPTDTTHMNVRYKYIIDKGITTHSSRGTTSAWKTQNRKCAHKTYGWMVDTGEHFCRQFI